jgi:hypothetical protein
MNVGKFTSVGRVARKAAAVLSLRAAMPMLPIGKNFARPDNFAIIQLMQEKASDHKLQAFFLNTVRQSFWQLGLCDNAVVRYVADVLAEFARADKLYPIRTAKGKKVESVVEMLAAKAGAAGDERDLLQERSLRKYVGDYTLFMSGMFRSHVAGRGFLDYYIAEGSRSYWTVSELDLSLYRTGFTLYQELSRKFEYYSGALDFTRKAYFAPEPGEDPFSGFLRQVEGWIKINTTEN